MLILSEGTLASIPLDAHELLESLDAAFRSGPEDGVSGLKAQAPGIDGATFQALPALLASERLAALKWVRVGGAEPSRRRIRSTTLLADAASGDILALLSSSGLTAIRTAAMSALAARYLRPEGGAIIGFLGCGVQARAHLDLFTRLDAGIRTVLAHAPNSAEAFAGYARTRGLDAHVVADPCRLIGQADVVISTVPPQLQPAPRPFDAEWLKPTAFASLVDLGRPWAELAADSGRRVFTDYVAQSTALVAQGKMNAPDSFAGDLYGLARGEPRMPGNGPDIFLFGGLGMCDAVVARLVYRRALESGIGIHADFE